MLWPRKFIVFLDNLTPSQMTPHETEVVHVSWSQCARNAINSKNKKNLSFDRTRNNFMTFNIRHLMSPQQQEGCHLPCFLFLSPAAPQIPCLCSSLSDIKSLLLPPWLRDSREHSQRITILCCAREHKLYKMCPSSAFPHSLLSSEHKFCVYIEFS